uniref:Uncharacterized protein n=1 Tax=Parascaris equorum TaxID=6256 RepID=A0A914RGM6_PAREQ
MEQVNHHTVDVLKPKENTPTMYFTTWWHILYNIHNKKMTNLLALLRYFTLLGVP